MTTRRKKPLKERFEGKYVISPNGCWDWVAGCYGSGYGNIMLDNRKLTGAHRASYMIHKGEIPEGLLVCHTCDNKLCVNPDHLFVGSHKDNMLDMTTKGRRRSNTPLGSNNCNSKLTEDQVLYIRSAYIPYIVTRQFLADKFGVTKRVITLILSRRAWKHI